MKKTRVLLVGSTGRMGQEISKLLANDPALTLGCGLGLGKAPGLVTKLAEVESKQIDLVIDFSTPKLALAAGAWCVAKKIPLVSGTTGFSEAEWERLVAVSKRIPFLYSANMSPGIATLRRALKSLVGVSDFDFQIVETHHKQKKDSPSGTAKTLQTDLEKTLGRKLSPVISVRGGGTFGIHEIRAQGESETLEFTHTALNRGVFAQGAIAAAKFLKNQKPGLYSLEDVLDYQD